MASANVPNGTLHHSESLDPFHEPIDHARPIKVICIGAGMSGILTAVRFPQRIRNLELTIYEKNAGIGGTWYENR
jgi:cation diffusion facilitator CzcD-associated flavoprotein CzcO